MTKPKNIRFIQWLNFGIFHGTVMFVYQWEYSDLTTHLKKTGAKDWLLGIEGDNDLYDKATYLVMKREIYNKSTGQSKNLLYLVLKKRFTFTDYEFCELAHEIVHLCQFHLPDFLDRNREIEAEAYLHTHLMTQALRFLRGGEDGKTSPTRK